VSRISYLARRYGFDALIVLAAIAAMLEVALRRDPDQAPHTTQWVTVPAIAIVVLPLLLRRRFPFAAPVSVWLLGAAVSFIDGRLISFAAAALVAGIVAAFLLGNLRDPIQSRLGLAVVISGAAIIVYNDPNHAAADFIFTPGLFAIAWLAGFALRERAVQAEAAEERARHAERERETAARIAVAEERARIARELHDIVAHAVSVMVLQVGAVRHNLAETQQRGALKGVEETGRAALAEMRRLLGAMRHDGEDVELAPQPGLDRLDSLREEVGRAGLPVRLHLDGNPVALPRAIDLSAYRIIQEGLTNTLKHAGAGHADVTIRYGVNELLIEIRDNGRGATSTDGLGHGLVGVRERVNVYGGEMTTATAADGGFVLSTRLPFSDDRP
jgi:signal transduction histidine kinase